MPPGKEESPKENTTTASTHFTESLRTFWDFRGTFCSTDSLTLFCTSQSTGRVQESEMKQTELSIYQQDPKNK